MPPSNHPYLQLKCVNSKRKQNQANGKDKANSFCCCCCCCKGKEKKRNGMKERKKSKEPDAPYSKVPLLFVVSEAL